MPAGLIALSVVPMIGGALRLTQLGGGAAVTAEDARFLAAPVPVVMHIIAAVLYCVLGAFQFAPGFRRRRPGWHRAAGRLLVPAGLVVAATGLWMTLFYPWPEPDGVYVAGLRIVFGTAMFVSIVLGFRAIRRRDIARHRVWMIRGYAIGQGAGTQALTHAPWFLLVGPPTELPRTLLMAAGWVINIVVVEWVIRKKPVKAPGARVSV